MLGCVVWTFWTAAAVLSILTQMCCLGDLICSCVLQVIPTFMLIMWILYTLVELFVLVTCCHWVFLCCDVCGSGAAAGEHSLRTIAVATIVIVHRCGQKESVGVFTVVGGVYCGCSFSV